jgi:hypothetical protein
LASYLDLACFFVSLMLPYFLLGDAQGVKGERGATQLGSSTQILIFYFVMLADFRNPIS